MSPNLHESLHLTDSVTSNALDTTDDDVKMIRPRVEKKPRPHFLKTDWPTSETIVVTRLPVNRIYNITTEFILRSKQMTSTWFTLYTLQRVTAIFWSQRKTTVVVANRYSQLHVLRTTQFSKILLRYINIKHCYFIRCTHYWIIWDRLFSNSQIITDVFLHVCNVVRFSNIRIFITLLKKKIIIKNKWTLLRLNWSILTK